MVIIVIVSNTSLSTHPPAHMHSCKPGSSLVRGRLFQLFTARPATVPSRFITTLTLGFRLQLWSPGTARQG